MEPQRPDDRRQRQEHRPRVEDPVRRESELARQAEQQVVVSDEDGREGRRRQPTCPSGRPRRCDGSPGNGGSLPGETLVAIILAACTQLPRPRIASGSGGQGGYGPPSEPAV